MLVLSLGSQAEASRRALVIGSNQGLVSEPVLEFAEQDAKRMAQIFTEAGWYLGQGEWTLSRTRPGAAKLSLRDQRLGQCFVLDQEETTVLAELQASDPAPVQLIPGRYRVQCISGGEAFAASALLGPGAAQVEDLAFSSVERETVLARGPGLSLNRRIALSLGVSAEPNGPQGWGSVAWVNDFDLFAVEAQLGASHEGVASAKLGLYGNLPWWDVLGTRLDVGLSGAYWTTFQDAGQVLFGPLVQLSVAPSPKLRLFLRQEVLRKVSLGSSAEDSLPLMTSIGVDWSLDE